MAEEKTFYQSSRLSLLHVFIAALAASLLVPAILSAVPQASALLPALFAAIAVIFMLACALCILLSRFTRFTINSRELSFTERPRVRGSPLPSDVEGSAPASETLWLPPKALPNTAEATGFSPWSFTSGVLTKTTKSIPLSHIDNFSISRSPLQNLLGIGTLRIDTPGSYSFEAELVDFGNDAIASATGTISASHKK